jgi:formylglycine-generating enzyme required for sulfatase activity
MINILHLSDLNMGTENDAKKDGFQLETDLTVELGIEKLDYVVISGDVARHSVPESYQAAIGLVKGLMSRFSLDPKRIVVVPGIHDITQEISERSYSFVYKRHLPERLPEGKYIPAGDLGALLRDEESYKQRFANFSAYFYKPLYGRGYPLEYDEQAVLFENLQDGILFLALNSCWEIDHHFQDRSGINLTALANVLSQKKGDGSEGYLKIAVCHHPVEGPAMMRNVEFMEQLSVHGFKVLMHGHIHEARQGFYHYDKYRCIHVIGAGTFGALPADQLLGVPLQYNLLRFDQKEQTITVETRKKEKPGGAWSADARWGDKNDPRPWYTIDLSQKGKKGLELHECTGKDERDIDIKIPDKYRDWIIDCCQYMDIDYLKEGSRVIQVRLPEIFVSLYANPPAEKIEDDFESDKMLRHQERPPDIDELISKNDYMLIEGLAGSGKTTLFKHFSFELVKQGKLLGLDGWMPVLIFLKDLKGFEPAKGSHQAEATTAEKILSYYFKSRENIIDMDTVKRFCSARKAIFLLDGLDEIDGPLRKMVANAFADFRISHPGIKVVLSGRPHGIDSAVYSRFGKKSVRILPFSMEQIEEFISKWFHYAYQSDSGLSKKTAQEMISEIKVHPSVDKLIVTPLMLTAICILYHDGKKLPEQRAELYKKFIHNLLNRRFPEDHKTVYKFLTSLAFRMHTSKTKGIDRTPAIEVLSTVYVIHMDENEVQYRQRLEAEFDRIESNCGLLKIERSQYGFHHLTFQEFLTSADIVSKETDYSKAISGYWDDEWYREVIELIVGFLSIENGQWAHKIVKDILDEGDVKPYKKWRLAVMSLLAIHEKTRYENVVVLARERMIEILDSDSGLKEKADAGEILGWLGDPRDLRKFVVVEGGKYRLSVGKMKIAAFEMGRFPVTNQWFEEFVMGGGYENESYWSPEGSKWLRHTGTKNSRHWHDRQWRCPNAPVVGICWYEAYAFTRWLTEKRKDGYEYMLPDENEWEAAASGLEGREFPWGGNLGNNRCNTSESSIGKTSSVGIFKEGATPDGGILDLAGNVWEWTCSDHESRCRCEDFTFYEDYKKYKQFPVLRGGSWNYFLTGALCDTRSWYFPFDRDYFVGFRCARRR